MRAARLPLGLASLALAVSVFGAAPTRAQWEPSGAISGLLAIEPTADERRLGGDLVVDLFERVGPASFGLAIGIGASTSDNDDVNRVFAPLGLSVGVGVAPRPIGFHVFLRGGIWAGATNAGLRAGSPPRTEPPSNPAAPCASSPSRRPSRAATRARSAT